jgi:tetratricopeptide (TPR) repeat protein
MNCIARLILPAFLLCIAVVTIVVPTRAQIASVPGRPAITILDSTKEQDGLAGSVRRVKTETARIEFKDGRPVEGPAQLVEVTTYGIKGNRIENTSYPIGGSLVGKEEYKYDEHGNITEMTVRDDRGAILSREAYSYEFDKFGNWTRMVTNLVVFENGELKREPTEVTYRTLTYYFDDNIAKIVAEPKTAADPKTVSEPKSPSAPSVPEPGSFNVASLDVLKFDAHASSPTGSLELAGDPPPPLKRLKLEGVESAFASRKEIQFEPAKTENTAAVEKTVPAVEKNSALEITDQKLANDLYIAGRNRFENGDAPGAIESYLNSIKLEPGSAEVHLNLGHAYLKLQKDREAIKAFKESIKLNANLAEAHYGLGFSNFRLARFRDAADAFKKATTLAPRMAKAHYGLSLAYQELGMTSALLDEYRTLEMLDRGLARKLMQTFPQYNFSCRLAQGCP